MKKVTQWIPWSIAALAVGITLYTNAVSYGGTKQIVKDTSIFLEKHCNEQKAKEKETDTVLNEVKVQLAVTQSQNGMVLESLVAIRKELERMRK